MTPSAALPLALYRANVDLQVRIGELVQAGSRHWLEFGQRLVSDGLVENGTGLQEIFQAQDWRRLLALPADAFWRQMQQRFGDQQAAAQLAVATQAAFARDLQDALARWQRETIEAMDQAGLGQAVPAFDADWMALFGQGASATSRAGAERRPADAAATDGTGAAGGQATPTAASPGSTRRTRKR
ncbi:phasin family protein [Pseudoxanthomonas sp. 10H]|uniref:phasin family protein n=1 Tax=Pseudoxanthomonas sp. 10H TaxID=3242729 RepID=UPI003557A20E